MCIVATVCIIGADTNLNNISVTHIAVLSSLSKALVNALANLRCCSHAL